jgi:integrase
MTKNKTFYSIATQYCDNHVLSDAYQNNVLRTAKKCKYMKADCLNKHLKQRLQSVSTVTVKSERTILLSLWKWAYENNLVKSMPKSIAKIKIARKPTKAWTIDQCRDMIDATFQIKQTNKSGVPLGLFIRTWLLLGYESGARYGDIFSFKYDDIDNNTLRWTMSKTGDPMTKILSDKCIENIFQLKLYNKTSDDRILGWVSGRRMSQRIMNKFLRDCGLVGSSKFLRRSGATHIEMATPGMAKSHLGHRTSGLAEKSYLDFGQIRTKIPQTPQLIT